MKNIISIITVFIILLVSIGINIYLLKGEGIHIHNDNRVDQRQWQNQSQSQMVMNMQMLQGKPVLFVKCKSIEKNLDYDEYYTNFFNEVFGDKSIIDFHIAKIFMNRFQVCIAYYEIYPEEWKVKKK